MNECSAEVRLQVVHPVPAFFVFQKIFKTVFQNAPADFLAYILVIFRIAFLCREPGSRKAISLVLFETWGHTFHMHAMFVENIIMFIRKRQIMRLGN